MPTVVMDEGVLDIPGWVADLPSFRRWTASGDFPEKGSIWFIRGNVWADMSKEQVYWHNQAKGEIHRALITLVRRKKIGRFFVDGLRLTNLPAEFSGVPDGTYVSFKTLRSGRARYVPGAGPDGGFTELLGIPDLVIEVMSDSSVDKDTEWLQKTYWEAEIPEYWLVDVRRDALMFAIFRHTSTGYSQVRAVNGWTKSPDLDSAFRLTVRQNGMGLPQYVLSVR